MFRTFLMTVLAVVAIGFGVGATAEAGDPGNWNGEYLGTKKHASVTVTNRCSDGVWNGLPVYALWVPSGTVMDMTNLDLASFLRMGARPLIPTAVVGTTIPGLSPGDGHLWVWDGLGGDFAIYFSTLVRGPTTNYFHVYGLSAHPVIVRY